MATPGTRNHPGEQTHFVEAKDSEIGETGKAESAAPER
jgi:hypothetical protein